MAKATEEELALVHNGMAQWALEIMKGVPLTDSDGNAVIEDGKVVRLPPAPAYLNVIRQFLKDNKIEAPEAPRGTALGDLSDLPVFDDPNVIPMRSKV